MADNDWDADVPDEWIGDWDALGTYRESAAQRQGAWMRSQSRDPLPAPTGPLVDTGDWDAGIVDKPFEEWDAGVGIPPVQGDWDAGIGGPTPAAAAPVPAVEAPAAAAPRRIFARFSRQAQERGKAQSARQSWAR